MICPKCKFSFFSRKYSTKSIHRNVKCPWCDNYFPSPMRADTRRLIKELLHDDLFEGAWRNLDILGRVNWLVHKVKDAVKKE
jgi:hypothetical protein